MNLYQCKCQTIDLDKNDWISKEVIDGPIGYHCVGCGGRFEKRG